MSEVNVENILKVIRKDCIVKPSGGIIVSTRTNHRTWLKIILNPILRKFGFQIVSCFSEQDKFLRYEIRKVNE